MAGPRSSGAIAWLAARRGQNRPRPLPAAITKNNALAPPPGPPALNLRPADQPRASPPPATGTLGTRIAPGGPPGLCASPGFTGHPQAPTKTRFSGGF